LADFQASIEQFESNDIAVVALSVDSKDQALGTVERLGLAFPVLHGLDAREMGQRIGAYINEEADPPHLHATGFILDPAGQIVQLVYSSGSIGRYVARDALATIKYRKEG
jgi:peroxiredoxin